MNRKFQNFILNEKKIIINILKIAFTVMFIVLLYNMIDIKVIYDMFRNVRLRVVVLGLSIYLLIYILRALRFKLLLHKRIQIFNLLKVVLVHGLYNRVLPFRIGEGAFPIYMKKLENVDYSESSVAVIIVRIFDLISSIMLYCSISIINREGYLNVIILMFINSALFFCICKLKSILEMLIKLLNKVKRMKKVSYTFSNIYNIYYESLTFKKVLILLTISVSNWMLMFIIFRMFIIEFNMNIQIKDIILAGSFSNLSSILPISSIGNFGTMEIGWAGILMMLGYDKNIAFSTGFSVNMVTFLATTILGLIGIMLLSIKKGGNYDVRWTNRKEKKH